MKECRRQRKLGIARVQVREKLCNLRDLNRVFEQATNHGAMMSHRRRPASKLFYHLLCKAVAQEHLKSRLLHRIDQLPETLLELVDVLAGSYYKHVLWRGF